MLVLALVARSGLAQTAPAQLRQLRRPARDVDSLGPGRITRSVVSHRPEIAFPVRLEAARQRAGTRQPETEDVACAMSEAQE